MAENSNEAATLAFSASVAASMTGMGVLITLFGCETGVTLTISTLVSSPAPEFRTSKSTIVTSQLSINSSSSPPMIIVAIVAGSTLTAGGALGGTQPKVEAFTQVAQRPLVVPVFLEYSPTYQKVDPSGSMVMTV